MPCPFDSHCSIIRRYNPRTSRLGMDNVQCNPISVRRFAVTFKYPAINNKLQAAISFLFKSPNTTFSSINFSKDLPDNKSSNCMRKLSLEWVNNSLMSWLSLVLIQYGANSPLSRIQLIMDQGL